ncbi:MAG: tetratricopeptide repeat protein [Brumimicrobium sp.]|nr:tetratricopeptide repeat protein [Brumimicrobium sp.]
MARLINVLACFIALSSIAGQHTDWPKLLKLAENDSIRFELQNQAFQQAVYANIDSSQQCLQSQKELIESDVFSGKTLHKFKIDYHVNYGVYHRFKGQSNKALNHYSKALNIALKEGFNKESGTIYNNIANIHYQNGDYHISLDYHLKSLKIRKQEGDSAGIGMSYGNIGLIYDVRKNYKKAISYYKKANTYFEKVDQKVPLAWAKRSIGTAHLEMEQFSSAISNFKESKNISKSISDKNGENYCLLNLGITYYKLYAKYDKPQYLDSAEYYLSQLKDQGSNPRIKINYFNEQARVLIAQGKALEALQLLEQSLNLVESSEMKNELKDVYELSSLAHSKLGNYRMAYDNHLLFKALSDTIFNIEKDREMGRKQAEAEYVEKLNLQKIKEKNQKKIFAYEKRQQLYIIIIISLSFILATALFLYLYNKKNKLTKQLKQERDTILRKFKSLEEAYQSVLENLERIQKEDKETPEKESLPDWVGKLSKRELEVLSCLAVGMSDKEIQDKLFISVTTVRTHCQRIYAKLLVKNRVEAVHIVRQYNLI